MYLGDLYPLGSILEGHMCLEVCPFLLDVPIYLKMSFQNNPYNSLDFRGICDLPFFAYNFINLGLFPLILVRFARGLSVLFIAL
jgi:hypothetical protein